VVEKPAPKHAKSKKTAKLHSGYKTKFHILTVKINKFKHANGMSHVQHYCGSGTREMA